MPYADIEKRREFSRSHYMCNKGKYNPGREIARAAFKPAREKIIEASKQRWVSPSFVRTICEGAVELQYDNSDVPYEKREKSIYDLALQWCLRGTSGWLDGGVFIGDSPFVTPDNEPWNKWARAEFLKLLPKSNHDGAKIELLILNITLKRIKLYGC